jgi:hypothetical protein
VHYRVSVLVLTGYHFLRILIIPDDQKIQSLFKLIVCCVISSSIELFFFGKVLFLFDSSHKLRNELLTVYDFNIAFAKINLVRRAVVLG